MGGNENAQKDKAVPTRQTGRPQRAAAKGRRYWEPSESGSDVESVASSQEEEQSVYKVPDKIHFLLTAAVQMY